MNPRRVKFFVAAGVGVVALIALTIAKGKLKMTTVPGYSDVMPATAPEQPTKTTLVDVILAFPRAVWRLVTGK